MMPESRRLKFLLSEPFRYGATETGAYQDEEHSVRYIRITDIDEFGRLRDSEPVFLTKSQADGYMLKTDDILFARSGATVGKSFLFDSDIEAAFAGYLIRARVDKGKAVPRFVNYACQTFAYWSYVRTFASQATIQNLNASLYGDVLIPYPGLAQQARIADFLDRETSATDALRNDCTRLTMLLEEKRSALISEAVTRGLDSTIAMRDSGVTWIGEIPAHWDVVPFKHCAFISEGQVNPRDAEFSDAILLAPNHVEPGTGKWLVREKASTQSAISGKYRVAAGDIVYSKIRPALNKVTLADIDCLCSADMYPLKPSERMISPYLLFSMLSQPFVSLTTEISMRVAMPKINRASLGGIPMPVPPVNEQIKIVEHLTEELSSLDQMLNGAREALSLVEEHRSALISAAVMGQIDVTAYKSQVNLEVA